MRRLCRWRVRLPRNHGITSPHRKGAASQSSPSQRCAPQCSRISKFPKMSCYRAQKPEKKPENPEKRPENHCYNNYCIFLVFYCEHVFK